MEVTHNQELQPVHAELDALLEWVKNRDTKPSLTMVNEPVEGESVEPVVQAEPTSNVIPLAPKLPATETKKASRFNKLTRVAAVVAFAGAAAVAAWGHNADRGGARLPETDATAASADGHAVVNSLNTLLTAKHSPTTEAKVVSGDQLGGTLSSAASALKADTMTELRQEMKNIASNPAGYNGLAHPHPGNRQADMEGFDPATIDLYDTVEGARLSFENDPGHLRAFVNASEGIVSANARSDSAAEQQKIVDAIFTNSKTTYKILSGEEANGVWRNTFQTNENTVFNKVETLHGMRVLSITTKDGNVIYLKVTANESGEICLNVIQRLQEEHKPATPTTVPETTTTAPETTTTTVPETTTTAPETTTTTVPKTTTTTVPKTTTTTVPKTTTTTVPKTTTTTVPQTTSTTHPKTPETQPTTPNYPDQENGDPGVNPNQPDTGNTGQDQNGYLPDQDPNPTTPPTTPEQQPDDPINTPDNPSNGTVPLEANMLINPESLILGAGYSLVRAVKLARRRFISAPHGMQPMNIDLDK